MEVRGGFTKCLKYVRSYQIWTTEKEVEKNLKNIKYEKSSFFLLCASLDVLGNGSYLWKPPEYWKPALSLTSS